MALTWGYTCHGPIKAWVSLASLVPSSMHHKDTLSSTRRTNKSLKNKNNQLPEQPTLLCQVPLTCPVTISQEGDLHSYQEGVSWLNCSLDLRPGLLLDRTAHLTGTEGLPNRCRPAGLHPGGRLGIQ